MFAQLSLARSPQPDAAHVPHDMSGWIKHGIDARWLHWLNGISRVYCLEFISELAVLGYRLSSVFTFGVKTRLSIKPGPEVHWGGED